MKTGKKILIGVLALLCVLLVVCTVYVLDDYPADADALACLSDTGNVTVTEENGVIVFMPDDPQAGLIFYPGVKVEAEAYAPLLRSLAENGICCAAVSVPLNIPILGVNAADGIREEFPQITEWYIGGHSMGGSVAAMYLAEHPDGFSGLIMLGSYAVKDISGTGVPVLLIYGDCDGVLNRLNFDKNRVNLPEDVTEVCIAGGCHAYFGSYGAQKGDGEPAITAPEQQELTLETILEWIGKQ